MKKLLYLLAGVLFAFNTTAQAQSKTVDVIIEDFSEACGEDPGDAIFCLKDEKGNKITERYSCNMSGGSWQVEPKDLITDKWVLNPKYKGKKAKLHCSKSTGGAGWVVNKVEFGEQKSDSDLDTDLAKYIGCYEFLSPANSYYIGKFPSNSVVHLRNGKYVPLDKQYIGKYFMVKYCTGGDTSNVLKGIGYVVSVVYWAGDIIEGIEKGTGKIHIRNFIIGESFSVSEAGEFGQIITGPNGKYCIKANNALYERKK